MQYLRLLALVLLSPLVLAAIIAALALIVVCGVLLELVGELEELETYA